MSYRNTSSTSEELNNKDSVLEIEYPIEQTEDKKDKKKETKKFFLKKESKDKGYSSLTGESNQDSIFLVTNKHNKKPISLFKKSFKDEKRLKEIKETKEEFKKSKKRPEVENFFGNYIENVVKSFASNDGVKVPAPIRICLDIIETKGIESEHLYRRNINKSQLESICDSINHNRIETRIDELNADPNLCGAIVKKFLRELKAPLINDDMLNTLDKFDAGISDKDAETKIEFLRKLISKMPQSNYELVAYLVMHFHKILNKSDVNKIEMGVFVQKFQPMFRIRERLFKFMILYADHLFSEFRFKKYRPKTNDETVSRFSLLPDNIDDLEQEISKQEIYLAKLHSKIANEESSSDKTLQEQLCDELWALQRYVTSLKRKVKKLKQERKNLETEQINKMKELNQQNTTNVAVNTNEQTKSEVEQQSDELEKNQLSIEQLQSNELGLICENKVLIETFQNLLERSNRERAAINDIQQKLINIYGNLNIPFPIQDNNMLNYQELYDNEQLLISENKLLEERINLINKRINNEKEKIYELKLSIQYKIPNMSIEQQASLLNTKNSLDMQIGGKIQSNLPDKELIMTKL